MIYQLLTKKYHDFYSDIFDAVVDLPPEKESIDEAPKTEDIFTDDNLFSDLNIEDNNKQYIDDLLQQVNHGDMRIVQPIVQP